MPAVKLKKESYNCGRKYSLVVALVLLAIAASIQSRVFNQTLTGNNATVQKSLVVDRPLTVERFQLEDHLELTLRTGPHYEDADIVQYPGVSEEKRANIDIKDSLQWYTGKCAEEMYANELEWYRFSEELTTSKKKKSSKSLLIAQYSNKGDFSQIFELTKPINMGYAERWNHDIVFLNGQNTSRGKVNPAALLRLAWEKRDEYDQLLLLDADAMMKNFRFDITTLNPEEGMLVAQRRKGNDDEHTWDVFGTVSLWNLGHLLTPRVQKAWAARFHDGEKDTSLAGQIKPYAETEVFTVTQQIGHSNSAYIETMQFTKRGEPVEVSMSERFDKWTMKSQILCKKYRLKCPTVTLERKLTDKQKKKHHKKALRTNKKTTEKH